ncbi:protein-tyrosine phosphatase [Dysgonomonas sp. PFB1-18]|uniref:tyrosine-protein phosphatase n=1 Tax=unclassified Dysgonomonas TaxID=2630389 RepID=UPI002472FEF2|nr:MULTISPECIES: tyrosine-protein phosphatase [unclassified Dysgonomonas]MDL2303248.1 tyrosine-protein phosphatase [Dysgonomonas sp. OttesenSCG-928-D17]MDH6307132.1 protein-tyrosine phosphatase [Dysgonomonas sp. PF1-14]MDH6337051.1 protein-tyrosine phosphatase [Dysgonomonas sp. PF1-16]MDH6381037.1 protein-tyrosine phosphatase [Dysgonomonas sp. PFB1-18]MDH6396384.1 protein-tyrosine phosphatase [Dysgonomonas sp. PF1-23]
MKLKFIACVISLLALYNCSPKPSVTALCEKDPNGNYILRWEMYPEVDNIPAEIFMSDNDSVFPSSPSFTVNSNDYITIVENNSDTIVGRRYFRIRIGGTTSKVITNRFFELDSIQNFRDVGGYITNDKKTVRWGKIFRSGSFVRMTTHDSLELNNLNIKTVIDLRSEDVRTKTLNRYTAVNNIRIPIAYSGYSAISQKVLDGQFLRGDAIIFTQDTYRDMINNFAEQYAGFFDYLCDEKNYPIVYHCFLGKDQSGLATYFLLRALDVPMDDIENDYMASDKEIDKHKMVRNADSLSESRQEAFTMLTKTDLAYLRYGISCIREKSGSVDEYMLNELKLTPEKRQKLKNILLH